MRLAYLPYILKFKNPAGTSRGILTEKPTYLLKIYDEGNPEVYGLGEASVYPGLSPEADGRYEYKIVELLANIAIGRPTDLSAYSSLKFGFEQAIRDFASGGNGIYFPSEFTEGKKTIEINGLVWMGNIDEMLGRIDEKIADGFRCIKLKIGAIDWHSEVEMIRHIRDAFDSKILEIRVDANGGFNMENALPRLNRLASFDIHSIEQPIPAGHPDLMAFLCKVSPLPIALDEEIIGISDTDTKRQILEYIHPAYIILKPSFCGGFSGAEEWISLAKEHETGWWVTSALESNVGLNALAQWTATLGNDMPQGLGTGALYTNNFEVPLRLKSDQLGYDPSVKFDREQFKNLPWRE